MIIAEPINVSPVLTLGNARTHWQQLAALFTARADTGDELLRSIFTGRLQAALR